MSSVTFALACPMYSDRERTSRPPARHLLANVCRKSCKCTSGNPALARIVCQMTPPKHPGFGQLPVGGVLLCSQVPNGSVVV